LQSFFLSTTISGGTKEKTIHMMKPIRTTLCVVILLLLATPNRLQAQLNTDRITSIGRNALYFDDYVLSIQYFNQVIKLKPYLAEPYLLRAIAKIQLQDYTGALSDCNRSIERNPFQPSAYYTRGFVQRQLGNLKKAEEDFSMALTYAPENRTYMMLRADVRAADKRYEEAMKDIDYLLARDSKSPTLLFEKGVICLHSKDTLCAFNAFTESVKYDSQNASTWSALGVVNMYMNNNDEAIQNLSQSITLGSKWAGDYINRGILYYQQHNYRGAMADYDKAVELEKNDASCYYNRGMLRAELGDYNRAIEDLNRAIDLRPEEIEMHYQRGMINLKLRQWKEAAEDFETMIENYPYFLPSYYLLAQAKTALGDSKTAYRLKQQAYELEQKKDSISAASKDSLGQPNTGVLIAQAKPQKRDRRKEFSPSTAQTGQEQADDNYNSSTRGNVQKQYHDVVNQGNVVLSYYIPSQDIQLSHYHYLVEEYNRNRELPSPLRFTTQEISLTAEMVNQHFDNISRLTERIGTRQEAKLFFARAIEFAMVQDYASAIDDCTKALTALRLQPGKQDIKKEEVIYTFCRANWRYKWLEYQRANGEFNSEYQGKTAAQKTEMDFDIMLRDYDYVTQLQSDFAFAYYNKANMLCLQKEYKAAILHYTRAISIDPDFAEAYFNRGLTRIYIDDVEAGIKDLSRAGELGIYQAYNLITRFQ